MPDSRAPAKQRRVADSVGRLGRDSPRKPREGYVELRQAECAVLACMESGPMLNAGCAHVGPSRAHVEPSWDLCCGHVWAIYVETILRCQFLRPRPPSWTAKMKFLPPKGPSKTKMPKNALLPHQNTVPGGARRPRTMDTAGA